MRQASALPERASVAPAPHLRARIALRYFALGVIVDAAVIGGFVTHPEWLAYFYAGQFPVLSRLIFGLFFFGLLVTYRNFVRLLVEERHLRKAVDATTAGRRLADRHGG